MGLAVIGRDAELQSIDAFLDRLETGPFGLVLGGEPGIGKTIVWEAGVERARRRQVCVLSCRCVESEASLSFGGLSDLVGSVLPSVAALLATPRRRALEAALLLAAPEGEPLDPRAVGLAFLDVLRALAERGPVVVAVDDLHWLDSSSARALQLALRRLREERIGFLATVREAARVPFELERSWREEQLSWVSVGPLSVGALHHLLRDRLGIALARPELVRLKDATGGNPFFALELGRELLRTGARPAAGRRFRVPESLSGLLGARLARLPAETQGVLLHAAALAQPTIEVIAAAQGGQDDVLEALGAAVREGVVVVDESRVRFAHPLLSSICYQQAPLPRRRAVHRALAGAVSEIEERARHLSLAVDGPDFEVAFALDAAAEQAARRGATASAAELSELAAELTAGDPSLGRGRRLRAADFHRLAGDPERARAMLEQLLAEVPRGVERADVLFSLASTLRGDAPSVVRVCGDALANADGDDRRSAQILAFRAWARRVAGGDVDAAVADARAALEKAERVGDAVLIAVAIAQVGGAETWTGDVTPGLLERGAKVEEQLARPLEHHQSPRVALARRLARLGELERARAILAELEDNAVARGDEVTRAFLLWRLGEVEWFGGRWQRALELVTTAQELADQGEQTVLRVWVGGLRTLIEADLGLVEQARASGAEALAIAQTVPGNSHSISALRALGHLELARGDVEAAGRCLRGVPELLVPGQLNDPADPVWSDAAETLIALSELDAARPILEWQEAAARRVGGSWPIAAAARSRGLMAAAEGDLDTAFAAFAHALRELTGMPYPLELGRTLVCVGAAHRKARQKRAAREAIEHALAVFDELGARLWADKARGELARISGRRRSDELTETEWRVARLAADGLSNKEIAAALFVSVHTVSAHLTRVYRKLGVRSRTTLARRVHNDDAAKV